jgi:phage major head subunit gpT-like protein
MQITVTLIQNLQVGFSKIFETAWRDTPQYWNRCCMVVSSSTKINTYGWMQRLAKMREWVGPRVLQNLNTRSASITNRDFEVSLEVPRNDIEDDQLGIFNPRAAEMGRATGYIWNQLWLQALLAGDSATLSAAAAIVDSSNPAQGLAFDGIDFFHATNHNLGGGVIANKGSEELTPAGWEAVKEKMRNYKGEDGRHLGVLATGKPLIVVPATGGYERACKNLFGRELTASGSNNTFFGEAEWIVVPELPSTVGWYVFDNSAPVKAFIMQKRKEAQLVSKTSVSDENVFWLNQFVWGADCRGECGYGPFFLAYHATGTTPDGREAALTEAVA